MEKSIIEIIHIEKKELPSKYGDGGTFMLAEVIDGKTKRNASATGDWVKNWKLGDTVEVIWGEPKEYKGVTSWKLKNPNSSGGGARGNYRGGGSSTPSIVHAYQIAAALAPIFFADKKPKLDDIEKLANAVLERLNKSSAPAAPAAEAKPAAPAEEVEEEEIEEEEDDF